MVTRAKLRPPIVKEEPSEPAKTFVNPNSHRMGNATAQSTYQTCPSKYDAWDQTDPSIGTIREIFEILWFCIMYSF